MEALVRGSRAPRVTATCARCGFAFERSAVHPYITDCPQCRGLASDLKRSEAASLKRVRKLEAIRA